MTYLSESGLAALGYPVTASENSFIVSTAGTTTLLAAQPFDRIVHIVVNITTAFAAGDGTQPTLAIGQTGSTTKFAATGVFTTHATGQVVLCGTLSATKALIATTVAGTGTTETGAYTIDVIASQITN